MTKVINYRLSYHDTQIIVSDFVKVTKELKKIISSKNISCYNFYLIRLASKNDIRISFVVKDMKNGEIKRRFENRLFGKVYKTLGWDININCRYYSRWRERRNRARGG